MRQLRTTPQYIKGRKRCKKRGLDLRLLDEVENIFVTRQFTDAEIDKYKVHNLSGKYKGYQELHLGNRSRNWLLVYRIIGNKVRFEDTYVSLENTGTHDECLGSDYINDNELIWL